MNLCCSDEIIDREFIEGAINDVMLMLVSPQTSLFMDVTPSPIKTPTEHPLSAFIKKEEEEEEEEATSCLAASVKQEVEPDSIEHPNEKKEEEPVTEDGATVSSAIS